MSLASQMQDRCSLCRTTTIASLPLTSPERYSVVFARPLVFKRMGGWKFAKHRRNVVRTYIREKLLHPAQLGEKEIPGEFCGSRSPASDVDSSLGGRFEFDRRALSTIGWVYVHTCTRIQEEKAGYLCFGCWPASPSSDPVGHKRK